MRKGHSFLILSAALLGSTLSSCTTIPFIAPPFAVDSAGAKLELIQRISGLDVTFHSVRVRPGTEDLLDMRMVLIGNGSSKLSVNDPEHCKVVAQSIECLVPRIAVGQSYSIVATNLTSAKINYARANGSTYSLVEFVTK